MNKILNIFYNNIIIEAQTGRVDCFLFFNMPFKTYIYETNEKYECNFNRSNELLVPTLIIKNKKEFDKLLTEYVLLALDFYEDINFPEEILDNKMIDNKNICKEKLILTTLWSNATVEDFANPIEFLKRRIAFFYNKEDKLDLGYIDLLEGSLELNITKDNIYNETPLKTEITIKNENGEKYHFPEIKFGIQNNKAYIYAIQAKQQEQTSYTKKINRKLYKVNDGFINDIAEENIKDITASFLVAANIFLGYLSTLGVEEILVPNVLIARWNAKSMAIMIKEKYLSEEEINKELENQNRIWININQKLIRIFKRLEYHHDSINITADPFFIDSYLHIKNKNFINCNNPLLLSTYNVFEQTTKSNAK